MEAHTCHDPKLCPLCNGKIKKLSTDEKTPSQGHSRVVFKIGDYVLKVRLAGWPSHDDLETWEFIQDEYPEYKQYFIPTLAEGPGWSIQPFVELDEAKDHFTGDDDPDDPWDVEAEYDRPEFYEAWEKVAEVCSETETGDIFPWWNWGINKKTGQPVIYDYGLN